ncbi:hypothetical protein QZH41_000207 [Actinostola sp. cb2023]|nr:hypothetical protein QZH41_000207 [Actinostola sp. cb2023]
MSSLHQNEHNDRIKINVSGKHFSAKLKHLQKHPNTLLGSDMLSLFHDHIKGEYFFDRDPELFRFILNFYRVGKLHFSEVECPGAFQDELEFFGIPHTAIDECCLDVFSKLKNSGPNHCERNEEELGNHKRSEDNHQTVKEQDQEKKENGGQNFDNTQESAQEQATCIEKNHSNVCNKKECFKEHVRKVETKGKETKLTHLCRQIKKSRLSKRTIHVPQRRFKKNLCCSTRGTVILQHLYGLIILASSLCNTVETIDCHNGTKCGQLYEGTFFAMETFFVVVFTIDYVIRFFLAKNKLTFVKQVLNIIDLLAILPYYLELVFAVMVGASDILITLRVLRVLRLMKLSRNSLRLQTLILTLRNSFKDLLFLYFIFLVGILLFGGVIYYVERDGSNSGNFTSIPHSLWFTCVTMVTTGYGDVVPVTIFGKIFAACCGLCGVLIMSLPIPIMQERKANVHT